MIFHLTTVCLCFVLTISYVYSFSINNTVADLKLFCTEKGILLKVFPEKPLDRPGRIYVKGQSEKQGCGTQMSTGLSEYEFNVPIGNCNMDKSATDKASGVSYHIVFVVSFHSIFLTKVDRAFRLTCSFSSANSMMVTNFFSVSMIPTTEVPPNNVDSLNCSYSIHAQDVNGPQLRYANIGEKVVHVWQCENLQSTQFMWVHDCSVSPEYGNGTKIIDERGCTLDRIVIDQLQYPRMDMVIGHHHAYKFADYPTLLFKCSITICDNVRKNCPIITTPPECAYPGNYGSPPAKLKRELHGVDEMPLTIKIQSDPLSVFALNEDLPVKFPIATSHEEEDVKNCSGQFAMLSIFATTCGIILVMQCSYFVMKRLQTSKSVVTSRCLSVEINNN